MSMFRKNTMTNTMFVRNVTQFVATSYTATVTTGGGGGGGGGGADSSIYDTLANSAPFKEIQRLSTQFANGSLPTLKNQLTPELYTTLSTTLATLALPNYSTYTQIYTQEQTTLMMLSQAVAQYNALLDAQATIQTNEECCAILNDMDRLMAYISGLRRQMSISPTKKSKSSRPKSSRNIYDIFNCMVFQRIWRGTLKNWHMRFRWLSRGNNRHGQYSLKIV